MIFCFVFEYNQSQKKCIYATFFPHINSNSKKVQGSQKNILWSIPQVRFVVAGIKIATFSKPYPVNITS